MKKLVLLFSTLIFVFSIVRGQVKMPTIFSDHMVLQAKKKAPIWGWAAPGSKVQIFCSWGKERYTAITGPDSCWKTIVKTPDAGGPYVITIDDGHPLQIQDVLIGEVWLCSGQSNMARPMKPTGKDTILGANQEFRDAHLYSKGIRYFEVARSSRSGEQKDVNGKWRVINASSLPDMSATAWFFGKSIYSYLNKPLGLITSSWGGSNIETWMSAESLSAFAGVKISGRSDTLTRPHLSPAVLYNNMIHPLIGYTIKGVIWYQGETNRHKPVQYEKLLPAMVDNWRRIWNQGVFPFYFMQIAPFEYETGINSAFFRESQLKTVKTIPNSAIGFLTDAGEEKNIHPANKKVVGERLAALALVHTYGLKDISADGPVYSSMQIEEDKIVLSFLNSDGGLTASKKEMSLFEIAGNDQVFHPAIAYISGENVIVLSPSVRKPVAARYAFKNFVSGELFNKNGTPASSFRTDDWPIK